MKNVETESVMLTQDLSGVRVAAIITDGFEQAEFEGPANALRAAGAEVVVLAQLPEQLQEGIQAVRHMHPTTKVRADKLITDADPREFDGLLIPGGALNADQLRTSMVHHGFVHNFMDAEKPVAVICHGAWVMADAGVVQGVTMTSWPAIRKDLERAGAIWKDEAVIRDRNVISSRKPDDVPAFTRAFAEQLESAKRGRKSRAA